MKTILAILFIGLNTHAMSEKSVDYFKCVQDKDCLIEKGPCFDVVSINAKFVKAYAKDNEIKANEGCWPRDYKNASNYIGSCSKNRCLAKIDESKVDGFYKAWIEGVDESFKLDRKDNNYSRIGYFHDFNLGPYLEAMGRVQKAHPNVNALRSLFKLVAKNKNSANEMLSFAMGDAYLANPENFDQIFQNEKPADRKHFCNQTNWGLLNANVKPTDKRLKLFEKNCGPLIESI